MICQKKTLENYGNKIVELESTISRNAESQTKIRQEIVTHCAEEHKKLDTKFANNLKSVIGKMEALTGHFTALKQQQLKLEDMKNTSESPTNAIALQPIQEVLIKELTKEENNNEKNDENFKKINERLNQLEDSLRKETTFFKSTLESNIYELELKFDALRKGKKHKPGEEKVDEDIRRALNAQPIESRRSSMDNTNYNSIAEKYDNLAEELKIFRKSITDQMSMRNAEIQAKFADLANHIMQNENEKPKVDDSMIEFNKKQETIVNALKSIQKMVTEKLKFKLKLDGIDDENLDIPKTPSYLKEETASPRRNLHKQISKIEAMSDEISSENSDKIPLKLVQKPELTKHLSESNLLATTQIQPSGNTIPAEALNRYVSREYFDNAIKNIKESLLNKADLTMVEKLNALLEKIKESYENYKEKTHDEIGNLMQRTQENENSRLEILQKLSEQNSLNTKQELTINDLLEKIQQKVSMTDINLLKNSINEYFFLSFKQF